MRHRLALLTLLLCLLAAAPAGAAPCHNIVDLGPTTDFIPTAINDDGLIVGAGPMGGLSRVWSNGAFIDVPHPADGTDGTNANEQDIAWDISDSGWIVGEYHTVKGQKPFRTRIVNGSVGGATTLPSVHFNGLGEAFGVNEDGTATGAADEYMDGPYRRRGLVWDTGGNLHRLDPGDNTSSTEAEAYGINDAGTVAGKRFVNNLSGGIWTPGPPASANGYYNLTPVAFVPAASGGGSVPLAFRAQAGHPINARGDVVGRNFSTKTAVLRSAEGNETSLGDFTPSAIADDGTVVGSIFPTSGDPTAVIRLPNTSSAVPLDSLIAGNNGHWKLTRANGVNANGDVIGRGKLDGVEHAFLLRGAVTSQVVEDLQPHNVGTNDVFDLQLDVKHTGPAGSSRIDLSYPDGPALVASAPSDGSAPLPELTPILGPDPDLPGSLNPGETTSHIYGYSIDSPGVAILRTRVHGVDSNGCDNDARTGVRIDATPRPPDRQELDAEVAGGLEKLLMAALDKRDELAAELSDIVKKKVKKLSGKPTAFEKTMANWMGLPDDALAWLPNSINGTSKKSGAIDVSLAALQGLGEGAKGVISDTIDKTAVVPFEFWRDYFTGSAENQARVNLELSNAILEGDAKARGYLNEAKEFYTDPQQLQAAWDDLPKMEAEAEQKLHELDVSFSNAAIEWDDLMKKDPEAAARKFGKVLGSIEAEVGLGWLQDAVGGLPGKALDRFMGARKAAGVTAEVSEVARGTKALAGAGAAPLAEAKALGNLSEKQVSAFQNMVKKINEKFGVNIELQARPINEYAAKVKGGIGKVEAVPTKNLTPDDVLMGAPEEWLGQTAYYKPKLPGNFKKLPKDLQQKLQLRLEEKLKEFEQFSGTLKDPTGKADKVRKALKKPTEFTLGKNGKLVMQLEKEVHDSGAVLIKYKKLEVNGKAVFTGKPRPIISDVDINAAVDAVTGRHLPAGIRGQVELEIMNQFAKLSEQGVFPFGFHGWTHSGFDIAAKDFRHILKYQLMYMDEAAARKLAQKYAAIYGVSADSFLEGYTRGKLLVKITAEGATTGLGAGGF